MRQLIHGDKETELILQIGKKYRVYATDRARFFDGDKYKDYTMKWEDSIRSAWLVRIDEFGIKKPFAYRFRMVNFGTWIIGPCLYDYEIEGPL